MKRQNLATCFILLLVVACAPGTPLTTPTPVTPAPSVTTAPTVRVLPTSTTVYTLTVPNHTATHSPTPELPTTTPTISPTTWPPAQCLEIAPNLPPQANLEGTIVLTPAYPDETRQIYLRNMQTGDELALQSNGAGAVNPTISPNGQWLAYFAEQIGGGGGKYNTWFLRIVSADGEEQIAIPDEFRGYLSYWLDNQRLVFLDLFTPGEVYGPFVPMRTLNPFTGELQELPPLPAEFSLILPPPNYRMIAYDPTLTYVVYIDQEHYRVFENLQTHEILARFDTIWEAAPRWSPDGQRFAILIVPWSNDATTEAGLYSIDLHGDMQKLFPVSYNASIEHVSYSWSPDGRHIAFWLITDPEHDHRVNLAILDTATLDVVNYCITYEYIHQFARPLLWAPNSQQLVLEAGTLYDNKPQLVVVVDIVQGWAAKIAEEMMPVGWMVTP